METLTFRSHITYPHYLSLQEKRQIPISYTTMRAASGLYKTSSPSNRTSRCVKAKANIELHSQGHRSIYAPVSSSKLQILLVDIICSFICEGPRQAKPLARITNPDLSVSILFPGDLEGLHIGWMRTRTYRQSLQVLSRES